MKERASSVEEMLSGAPPMREVSRTAEAFRRWWASGKDEDWREVIREWRCEEGARLAACKAEGV